MSALILYNQKSFSGQQYKQYRGNCDYNRQKHRLAGHEKAAPWQKGGIENTNGLIRQYIPNGTDFKNVSQQEIKMIQRKINARPREKLNVLIPDEVVYKKTL